MKYSLQDMFWDLVFDTLDLIQAKKKLVQLCLAAIILGTSTGFAGAKILPNVDESELILASVKEAKEQAEAEALHAAAVKEQEKKVEESIIVNEDTLQEVYTEVITQKDPSICAAKLQGKYIESCVSNYWTIQASVQADAELCNNINEEEAKTKCKEALSSSEESFVQTSSWDEEEDNKQVSDILIEQKSQECLAHENEVNQNVCWNSLYLSVAMTTGEIEKCDNIKDEASKEVCKIQAERERNKILKAQALQEKDLELCSGITDTNMKQSCVTETTQSILTVSESCDQECINTTAEEIAIKQADVRICNYVVGQEQQAMCKAKALTAQAIQAKDSRVCMKIPNETQQKTCVSGIQETEDNNPEVQEEVFKNSDRAFPEIGSTLINPLEESPFASINTQELDTIFSDGSEDISNVSEFQSVLSELNSFQANSFDTNTQGSSQSISTSICDAYTSDKQRIACEDSLVLQVAVSSKDISKCQFIQDISVQEYCELEIVQGDAIRAAEAAKRYCQSLSTSSAQQKCLKNLGFFSEEVENENAADCLDYADPLDRIACMRELKQ